MSRQLPRNHQRFHPAQSVHKSLPTRIRHQVKDRLLLSDRTLFRKKLRLLYPVRKRSPTNPKGGIRSFVGNPGVREVNGIPNAVQAGNRPDKDRRQYGAGSYSSQCCFQHSRIQPLKRQTTEIPSMNSSRARCSNLINLQPPRLELVYDTASVRANCNPAEDVRSHKLDSSTRIFRVTSNCARKWGEKQDETIRLFSSAIELNKKASQEKERTSRSDAKSGSYRRCQRKAKLLRSAEKRKHDSEEHEAEAGKPMAQAQKLPTRSGKTTSRSALQTWRSESRVLHAFSCHYAWNFRNNDYRHSTGNYSGNG